MLVVTGPPRSGTSLVCNLLQRLGCDFGPEDKLIPGNQWNELGYFENTEIVGMNHRLILGSWVDPTPWTVSVWPDSRLERLRRLVVVLMGRATMTTGAIVSRSQKLQDELETLKRDYAYKTVKDPRFCFTLPAWKPSVRGVLLCVRHPREVADSMARQSGFHRGIGMYAWHRWTRWFWRHDHSAYPVGMVDYNRLITAEGFEGEMRRLYAFMGKPFDAAEAAEIQKTTVRLDLHHNRTEPKPLPFPIRWAYEDLMKKHEGHAPPSDVVRSDPLVSDDGSSIDASPIPRSVPAHSREA